MKTRWTLVMVFIFTASTLLAQATPADAPSSREDIRKLFDVMQVRQQMRLVMEQVSQQMKAMTREALKKRNPEITEEELARIDSLAEENMKGFPVDSMLDDMIPVYQKHLTKTDVNAMIGFYSSATGQKLLREMPAMTSEGMQAAYGRMQKQMDATLQRVERMVKEEQEKQKQAAPAKPAPPQKNQ